MKYKETTSKLGNSRIIKFALIGIFVLVFLRLISFGMTAWLIFMVNQLPYEEQFKVQALLRFADLLSIPIAGAIATIVTGVVARYAVRETSGNVANAKLGDHESGVFKEENMK